ncbi:MAG: glycosyl transferase family 51 [Alphaproteobacteria bacterium]|nr:glycosyl transferase family 51 [Alphaproteobacteria bacterium]
MQNFAKNNLADSNGESATGETPHKPGLTKWFKSLAISGAVITAGSAIEMETSFLQSLVFNAAANGNFCETYTIDDSSVPAANGPYDERLGYSNTLNIRKRLSDRGYVQVSDTKWQDCKVLGVSLFPLYSEKAQAGLSIVDEQGQPLFEARYPRDVFKTYDDLPPILVKSLLFVENRELLDTSIKRRNPAIEWKRLFFAIQSDLSGNGGAGASTLATQIEKFKHSPGGETSGDKVEKFRQMFTASTRAYQHGLDTTQSRHEIVLNYVNGIPMSAVPGFGEVHGFSDGLRAWFGKDPNDVSRILQMDESDMSEDDLRAKALAYRETLSIIMSVKKPTAYLRNNRDELKDRVDAFLPLLAEEGIISPALRDAALKMDVVYADPSEIRERYKIPVDPQKAKSSMQIDLMKMLGLDSLYQLNRYDLRAETTLDVPVDRAISQRLHGIKDAEIAAGYGLTGYRLLPEDGTANVTYTFTLYERLPNGQNVLRVQADNYDGQFNLNEDSKLELGSTAKLRTLVSYMEAISELHQRLGQMNNSQRNALKIHESDNLTQFVVDHLNSPDTDKSLNGTLEASLDRTYSGNPGERFFTGGGLHRFSNFDNRNNGGHYTVKESLHQSLNLPFIRIMRDVVNYTIHQKMDINPDIYTNTESEQRRAYLEKFAEYEGKIYLWRSWKNLEGKNQDQILDYLAENTLQTPTHLAVVFRSVKPEGTLEDMKDFMSEKCVTCTTATDYEELYEAHAPGKFNLHDRGYLTGLHPLAIWLGGYLSKNPDASWSQTKEDSRQKRIEVYDWLLNSNKTEGQNTRIRTIVEQEAFEHIQETWKRLGFPFEKMTPSLASALGSSGDTPAALATLAGILQNDGLRVQSQKFSNIHFAKDTPYEQNFNAGEPTASRVLPSEVARLARREMQQVVEVGTARRARGSVKLSDGRELAVGAKTGTGDNRQFHSNGSSTVKSRTATFVYTIGDRFYGCVTAFVEGQDAARYNFTSGLTAQIFSSVIAPELVPLLDRSYGVKPAPQAMDLSAYFSPETSLLYKPNYKAEAKTPEVHFTFPQKLQR